MTNYTTSTPVTSTVEDIYGLLGVGTSNTGKLLNPTALISSAIGSLTVADTSQIDLSYTGGQLSGTIVNGSIGTTQLSSGVNTSLGLANTAVQPAALSPYLTTATAASTYLPLSGGALTGAVTSTSSISSRQSANTVQFLVASGTAQTINWNNGGSINLDLSSASGNVTLTLQNPVSGAIYRMRVQQGATVRNLTFPAGTVQQGGGGNVYTGIAGVDFLTVYYNGSAYLVQSALNSGFVQPTSNAVFTNLTQLAALRLNNCAVIVSNSAFATRTDGSALAIGDLWYNPSNGTQWFWNGTYWLTTQVYGPRGSMTFVGSSESFVTINDGVGLVYGAFVEKLVFRYKARTTNHNASNYRRFDFTFRGARNQTDEYNYSASLNLDGTAYPLPTTSYSTVSININSYAGARGDISINTASSTIVAGSPDPLDASFALYVRGVAP
jgi:hypothetical protein